MKKIITITCCFLLLSSCSSIIEGSINNNIPGTWNLTVVTDVDSGSETIITSSNSSNKMLGVTSTAITFGDDKTFDLFLQSLGPNGNNGTFDNDFFDVTFQFDSGSTLVRKITSINESNMTMQDTINGKAKLLTFIKEI